MTGPQGGLLLRPTAGDEHAAAPARRAILGEQSLVFAVVKDEQTWHRMLPGSLDQSDLVLKREAVKIRVEGESARATAGRHFCGHRGRSGEAQPKDPPAKNCP